MLGILGKKIGMTNIFDEAGRNVPVTVIEAGPCYVLQVKTKATDGYDAVQMGFGEKREKNGNDAGTMKTSASLEWLPANMTDPFTASRFSRP